MKNWKFISCLLFFSAKSAFAQVPVSVEFSFHNAGQPFVLDETITAYNGVNYSVQSMAFYMSRIQLIHDGNQVTSLDTNEVFYINFTSPGVNLGSFNVTNLEGIRFDVGVPVYLNHLDISQYPEHHPLSFHQPAMHWGWAAGYFHMVMNGKGDDNTDGVPTVAYELNNLGDDNVPTAEIMTIPTLHPNNEHRFVLICNVDEWLRGTDPATTSAAHGSDPVNVMVMQNVEDYPVFTSPANASVVEKEQIDVSIAQSALNTTVSWSDAHVSGYTLFDARGGVIEKGVCSGKKLEFNGLKAGLHLIRLENDKQGQIGTAKWIVP